MNALDEYIDLFRQYVDGHLSSDEFRTQFLELMSRENRGLEEGLYEILDQAFGDTEMFEPDPVLYAELERNHPGMYLSEEKFRRCTIATFAKLKDYAARLK